MPKPEEQMEFPFVKDCECKAHDCHCLEEIECAEDALEEFEILMNKYSVSLDDMDRIALLAKFF